MESGSRPSVRLGFFCKMLERIEDSANCNAKRSALQRLLEAARRAGDLYGVVRLLIPQRDLERQNYSMKETVLASCMLVALGIAPKSVDGQLLFDWKRAKNTAVGDFASIALQVMAKRQSNSSSDISIPEVNSLLDGIAISNTREEKGSVLRDLISKTTANEMKWVLRIILKDVIFDLLYEEKHGSVIHLSLKERRNILKSIIQPSFPQLFYLGEGNTRWSIVPTLKEELADFFVKTVQQGEEGIVVKDLSSQWCPDNRDGRWCKIKPDYVSMGNDLDLLIIGGYYGRSQYGGCDKLVQDGSVLKGRYCYTNIRQWDMYYYVALVASYLLALVDESEGNHSPRKCCSFISICRCGSGLSEDDRYLLQRKLAPFFLVNKKGGRPPNSCKYLVTNSRYECPDVSISKPEIHLSRQTDMTTLEVIYLCNMTEELEKENFFTQIQQSRGTIAMNLSQCVTHVIASEAKGPMTLSAHLRILFTLLAYLNLDSQCIAMISLRRFKLEVEMRGASVSNKLCGNTTHMVVYVADKINLSFKTILYSLSEPERTLAWTPQLCIISHVWIEDCIRFWKRLDSKLYSLRNEKELSKSLEIKCDRPKVEEAPMQSIMANSLNSNNEKPPNEGDSSRECFPEVACKERQMDSSCVRSSQFSKLKGLDKSECSSEPWKDSASDVVENMTQIFLGPPYNSLSLSSSTDIVHNLHTCSSSSKWEETPENHDYLAPKKQKVQVDRSVGLFSQSLSLITDTENFAAVEAGKGPVYVPRRRFTAKDFAHLLD